MEVLRYGLGWYVKGEPTKDTVAAYERLMREEAYATVDNILSKGHYFSSSAVCECAPADTRIPVVHGIGCCACECYLLLLLLLPPSAAAAKSSSGASSLSAAWRARVSGETASMPTLCVSWESSILVRSEESSIDIMQAIITGPRDTAYGEQ